jgi:histidine ammonia-lyase
MLDEKVSLLTQRYNINGGIRMTSVVNKTIKNVIVLGKGDVSIEDVVAVARHKAKVTFSEEFIKRVKGSNNLIKKFVAENRKIYGVTTGFGKNVEFVISPEEAEELQTKLVRSHSAAVGEPVEKEVTRAIMMMQLVNTGKGFSGISLETITLIKDMLNADIVPYAPGEGSVGYIAVEGFLVMAYIGEGGVWVDNQVVEADIALKSKGLKPIKLKYKEGICLLNGSMSVCAYAAMAVYDLMNAAKNIDISGSLAYEALRGNIEALDERVHSMKKHREQNTTAEEFRKVLEGSEIMEKYEGNTVQDAYLLRSSAHIHGAAKKTIKDAYNVVTNEMNSVSDNPIIYPNEDYSDGIGLMGGNFDGSFVSLYCDSACLGACMLAKIADKRMDRIVSSELSGFPPFLARNPGLNNGYMIPQYTISGLFSEISNLSTPVSVQSISTCARQEEPVSLAYLAGKKLYKIANKLKYIAAIEIMMSVQGIDFLKPLKPSKINSKIYNEVRKEVLELDEDRFYHNDIEYIYKLVNNKVLVNIVEEEIGVIPF